MLLAAQAPLSAAAPPAPSARLEWERRTAAKDRELLASPTSYLNLNDVAYLAPGEKAYLDLASGREKARWLKEPPKGAALSLEFAQGGGLLRRGGAEPARLTEEETWIAPSGLVVRVVVGERLWAFLHDPKSAKLAGFRGLARFPYDPAAVFQASFEKLDKPEPVFFPTSQKTTKRAFKAGRLWISKDGKRRALDAFTWREGPDGVSELFVPFRDQTTGKRTYGGGRYLEPRLSGGLRSGEVTLDFNDAHNPMCARSPFFNCPIYAGNRLDWEVRAGELAPPRH